MNVKVFLCVLFGLFLYALEFLLDRCAKSNDLEGFRLFRRLQGLWVAAVASIGSVLASRANIWWLSFLFALLVVASIALIIEPALALSDEAAMRNYQTGQAFSHRLKRFLGRMLSKAFERLKSGRESDDNSDSKKPEK